MKVTHKWTGNKVAANTDRLMMLAVERCAWKLEGEVKIALSRAGANSKDKQKGMYYNRDRSKWVEPSPAGTPPYTQTGMLKNSIAHIPLEGGMAQRVGPRDRLEYARRHELGDDNGYPARPYLGPTFTRLLPWMTLQLRKAARKGLS